MNKASQVETLFKGDKISTQKINFDMVDYIQATLTSSINNQQLYLSVPCQISIIKDLIIIILQDSDKIYVQQIRLWNIFYKSSEQRHSPEDLDIRILSKELERELIIRFNSEFDFLQFEQSIRKICVIREPSFTECYTFHKPIGKGSQAQIDIYYPKNQANKYFAVKQYTVKNNKKRKYIEEMIYREIELLQELGICENVIHLDSVYRTSENTIMLVTKFAKFGSLTSFLRNKRTVDESQIRMIMEQLLLTIDLMHRKRIVHRDIKPDNILVLKDESQSTKVCFADLGMACRLTDTDELEVKCGTPGYVDPAILNNKPFKQQSDIFSLGVVFYNMVTNKQIFTGVTANQIYYKNKCADPQIVIELTCKAITSECRDLLSRMLMRDQEQRPNAEDCLKHPWFSQNKESLQHIIRFNIQATTTSGSTLRYSTNKEEQKLESHSFVEAPNYFQNLNLNNSFISSTSPVRGVGGGYCNPIGMSTSKISYSKLLQELSSTNMTTPEQSALNNNHSLVQYLMPAYKKQKQQPLSDQSQLAKYIIQEHQQCNLKQRQVKKFTFARQESSIPSIFDEDIDEYLNIEQKVTPKVTHRRCISDILTQDKQLILKNARAYKYFKF